jgi:two-component system, chemotaxis family, sensor kinase CheA
VPELAARLERLNTVFGVELADRIQSINALILQLERADDDEALGPLARQLHSLKGAARAVGARSIEQVAHSAEGATVAVRKGSRPDQVWFDALYAAVDSLKTLERAPTTDISPIIAALVAASPESPTAEPIPISSARTVAPQAPTPAAQPAERIEQNSVRVSLGKLDTLLTESGELSVTHLRITERLSNLRDLQRQLERWQREWSKTRPARARLRRAQAHSNARDGEALFRLVEQSDEEIHSILQRTRQLASELAQNTAQLAVVSGAISQEVIAIRLLPAGTVFMPLERLVRDLSRQTGKEMRLTLSGTDTEVDRRILDELRDPLMHMVRNSVDHGIEPPQERQQAGKPAYGTLHLSATQRGDRVHITIEDDGRGLDVEGIRETAIRRNVVSAERAEQMDAADLIELIFAPGFSTRATISEISGRGVGMDVVREHVNRLGGNIGVRTTPGAGTCFTITVPLTLATTRVLLVGDGGQIYAVPSSSIERTGRVRASDMHQIEGRRALQIDGRAVPVVELADVLQRGNTRPSASSADEWRPFVLLPQGDRAVALLTDRLIDETELVVKSLGAPLMRVRHVGGAAVLGTGAVVVILNPADLIKSALGNIEAGPRSRIADVPMQAIATRRQVLVVDDSVMTRTLERTILEAAGYSVVVAIDGAQALDMLTEHQVDLIISDVEMPRMDGFELTSAVRQDERWRHLPIVLVTSLDAPEQVERGAAAGADAYIVKGRFDQNDLLQTIGRLL